MAAMTRYQPTTDKVMRLNAQTTLIENGFVRIPENAPWLGRRSAREDCYDNHSFAFLESFIRRACRRPGRRSFLANVK